MEPNGHGNLIQSSNQRSGVLNYVYDIIERIQEASRQYRDLDIRVRPVRTTPLQRTPRQTRLDEYRPQTHPLRLGRNAITSGVHLQRLLYLSLHRPRQLRTAGANL